MGRPIQYNDPYHQGLREQIKKSRLKYKDAFKPIDKPIATVKPIDNPKIRQNIIKVINESPTLNKRMEQIKQEPYLIDKKPYVMDSRIAQKIQSRKCLSCKDQVGCQEPCEEFIKLYEYERIASTRPKSFGI